MYVNGKLRDIEFLELSTFEGKHYFFEVTEAVLNGTPRWKENVAYPPLSPRDAEAAARAELQLLRPDVGAWMLVHIVLRQIIGQCWCYVVVFHRGDIAITGLPEYLSVPVLMNGQAVHGTPESQVGK
jgi:hypothetical protein